MEDDASHQESRLPQLGRDKRRSFLPAPSKFSNLPTRQTDSREASPLRDDDQDVPKFKVGDRICIGGVKHGILRYLGEVHIAAGIWCGIELDDPDGKHDGEVEGHRYFFCRKQCGVFAPYDKVDLVEPVDVPIKVIEVPESVLKRRSLPRPSSALPKSALPSVRPVSAGSLTDIKKQVDDVRAEIEEEAIVAPAPKEKGSVIQQKSQIAKISGIPRVGLASGLPSSQLKQQDGGSASDLRYRKDLPQRDIKGVFSNLIPSKSEENVGGDRYGSSDDVNEAVKQTSAPSDQVVPKQQKPSRLPGASRLPTKYSKLERPSPTEPKPPPIEEVKAEVAQPLQLARTLPGVNKTFDVCEGKQEEQEQFLEAQSTSGPGIEDDDDLTRHLGSDSRQFLNITFDAENNSQSPTSLPDVVSSASMSPDSVEGSQGDVDRDSQTTKGNTDEASLDLLDDEAMWDNTDLEDDLDRETKMAEDRVRSDVPVSSPLVASTPLPSGKRQKYSDGEEIDDLNFSASDAGKNIKDLFPKLEEDNENANATFSVDSSGHSNDVTIEESSCVSGKGSVASPAKSARKCDLIDTVESSRNASSGSSARDQNVGEDTFLVEKGITDITMPMAEMEEIRELEKTKVEDILEGMSKSVVMDLEKAFDGSEKSMTDSGIMDPVTLNRRSMTDSGVVFLAQQENRKSMTESGFQELIKGDKKPMVDSGISDGSMTRSQQLDLDDHLRLEADLKAGHMRKERPISLISTTSADTGYVPDTDSEAGTLTTNSPLDWMEKHGSIEPALSSVQEQDDSYKESFNESHETGKLSVVKDLDGDSDFSDIGATRVDTDTGQSDVDEAKVSVPKSEISGLSPLASDASSLQGATAQTVSPSSANSSLIEDDRAEADQIHHSAKGGNQESSAENTLKDLSDSSPDGGDSLMPVEESVISREITDASQGELSINVSVDTTNESASHEVSVANTSSSVNTDDSVQGASSGDKSAIELDKSGQSETGAFKTPSKGKSATLASKKKSAEKVIEHKKPNLNVRSSLADYIRAPVPTKPKEEKGEDVKTKKNVVNKKRADNTKCDVGKSPESANDKTDENSGDSKRIRPKVEKELPKIIKRTPPKSKWDNIMSQIDSTKVPKPKPKSEIKSKLEEYLSTPVPTPVKKEKEPKKETKPRVKLVSTPKPDYSKIKSKLSISAPPPKREQSPAGSKAPQSPRHKSPGAANRASNGNIVLDFSESLDNSVCSARSSRTDLSMDNIENGPEPPHPSKLSTPRGSISRLSSIKTDRPDSVTSTLSDGSQGSVKVRNAKNKKTDLPKPETPRVKKYSNVKSSIPPPAPRKPAPPKTSPKKTPETSKSDVSKTSPKKATNQNRNRSLRTPSKTNNHLKGSHQPDIVSNSLQSTSEKEISRLETLCESRTKELNMVKMQLKSTSQAFEAMTCLVKYLTQELDAFSCPVLAEKLQDAEAKLEESQTSIGELESLKSRLEGEISDMTKSQGESTAEISKLQQEIASLNESHEQATTQLKQEHEGLLQTQKESLSSANSEKLSKAKERHEQVVSYMKDCHDRNVSDINLDRQRAHDALRLSHLEDIEKLRTKHDNQMEELHKQHRDKLEDITHRFETIKMTLGEKVETLRGECEDLRTRARISEDALLRDSDVKLQLALQPFRNLPAEIESLKLVIEMRNQEIQKLRKQNMELEKQLEDLPIAKEKIASLQQKGENLEAIINIKTDHEKQLHEKCMNLMRKYDKESKANKRLSMDYEQLAWKMDQDFGSTDSLCRRQLSRSPTRSECGSPDLVRKGLSPINSEVDSPGSRRSRKSTSSTGDDSFERKLKRRSATFLLEKEKSSPSASPQAKRLSPSSFENSDSPPQVMSQSAGELTYSVSPGTVSPPDSNSLSVSQSMSQSMTQSMSQSMTDSDIFGDFESSGIIMNGQEITVSLPLPAEREEESEVFTVEQDTSTECKEKKEEKTQSDV